MPIFANAYPDLQASLEEFVWTFVYVYKEKNLVIGLLVKHGASKILVLVISWIFFVLFDRASLREYCFFRGIFTELVFLEDFFEGLIVQIFIVWWLLWFNFCFLKFVYGVLYLLFLIFIWNENEYLFYFILSNYWMGATSQSWKEHKRCTNFILFYFTANCVAGKLQRKKCKKK